MSTDHLRTVPAHECPGTLACPICNPGDPMEALRVAAVAFRRYEQLHRAKVGKVHHVTAGEVSRLDAEANEKADANARLADMCERAIPALYALGLLTEEMGEALQIVGKGLRFGIAARGPSGAPYHGSNAYELLPVELGDVGAATDYAEAVGLVMPSVRRDRARQKLGKLLSSESRDAQGQRLAPDPAGGRRS